jgi:AcrR family transcriptional regulator
MLQKDTLRVDPRVRRTRQRLQQAMHELMQEKDLPDINIQDITDRADLNRATFYKHYIDKYDLLNTVISERFQTMLDARLPPESILTATTLNILIQTGYDCVSGFPGYCGVIRVRYENSMMLRQVHQKIHQVLLSWLQNPAIRSKLHATSAETLALAISWMIAGPVMRISQEHSLVQQRESITQLVASVHTALAEYLLKD